MAKISGHGAFIVKSGTPNKRVENASFDIETDGVIDEVTDSESGGVAEGLPILVKVQSCVIEVMDTDSANFAITLGITENAVVSLWFKDGTRATGTQVTNTIVRSVRLHNPQNAARRVTITTEYGTLTRVVTQPSLS